MLKLGLKLWSTNKGYLKDAVKLFGQGVYDYIELYVVPNSYAKFVAIWSRLKIPYVIHSPHFTHGVNLAKKEHQEKNFYLIKQAQQFADKLKADKIIVHLGVDGSIKEATRQLQLTDDRRVLIENMSYYSIKDNLICNGSTIEELNLVLENCSVGFCLDIGHAIYSANAQKLKPMEFIKQLIKLKPKMFHLSDGDLSGVSDNHLHFGEGNYEIEKILALLPSKSLVTIETPKDFQDSLSDFEKDIFFLNRCLS